VPHNPTPRDPNQLARVIGIATGETEDKQPLASARKGGLKCSEARMKVLTPEQRSEIARVAASARWKSLTKPRPRRHRCCTHHRRHLSNVIREVGEEG